MMPIWYDGDLAALPVMSVRPIAWSINIEEPAADQALATVPARTDDLADAARRSDGAISLIRRRLARALIAKLAKCHPDDVIISRSSEGASRVTNPKGWHLSISGQRQRCLIGVANVPIGVDMEMTAATDLAHDPVWDMMTFAEAGALQKFPAAASRLEWLRRWSAKEAHAKLIGQPRRIDPRLIETTAHGSAMILCNFEGHSICWSRSTGHGLETVAIWDPRFDVDLAPA